MSDQKVYEGRAELNIQPFLKSLETLENRTGLTAGKLTAMFKMLDQTIQGSLGGVQSTLKAISAEVAAVGSAVNAAKAQLQSGQQAVQQLQQQSQAQQRASQQAGAARRAESRAEGLEAEAHRKTLQTNLDAELMLHKQHYAGMLKDIGTQKQKVRDENLEALANGREFYEKQAVMAAEARKKALLVAANQQRQLAEQMKGTVGATFDEGVYKKALAAAETAKQQQIRMERQVSEVIKTEMAVQLRARRANYEESAAAARKGNESILKSLKAGFEAGQYQLKEVEDRWNSIYRAGSQLVSLGSQLSMFSRQVTQMGLALVKNTGEFDFWVRRVVASTQAANTALGESADTSIVSLEKFKDATLEIGRQLGVASPQEIAQTWYFYQSAVGDAITTTEEMAQAQHNIASAMRAGIVTNTSQEQVIRGVTSAMAEFNLGSGDFDYALSVILNTTQVTQAEFSDMLQAFKMAGPQFQRLGMSVADAAAAFAMLADQNIRGTQAGRLLQSGLTNLIRPTEKMKDSLQDLFVTQRGLTGSWEQFLFKGGEFVGLFDKMNAQGELVTKGALHQFFEATKQMTAAQREFYLASVFGKDAGKAWSTIIDQYSIAQVQAERLGGTAQNAFEKMVTAMRDPQTQLKAFGEQWKTVAEGTKVQMGQVLFTFEELKQQLGTIIAAHLIPFLQRVAALTQRIMEWAKANPALASTIVKVAMALAVLAGVVGPLLAGLGYMIQGFAGLALVGGVAKSAFTILTSVMGGLGGALSKIIPLVGLLHAPILVLVAAVALLALAWRNNWLGIGDILGEVVGSIGPMLSSLAQALGGLLQVIAGFFTKNDELVAAGAKQMLTSLIDAFYTLNDLAGNLFVWGHNLMVSLANGIIDGSAAVWRAVEGIAEGIAKYFRSFSPPKHGPLKGIQEWGKNLINTLIDGMKAADFDAINEVADQIAGAIRRNIEDGLVDPSQYASAVGQANSLVSQMIDIIKGGGHVGDDFFANLKPALGEWYDYIVSIAQAYEQVYAAQQSLGVEQEKLETLRKQREELEKQGRLRADAFDKALGKSDASNFQNNTGDMVDPLSSEGQRKIEQMRRSLNTEDFQNWLNWQKQMWAQRADAEDKSLTAQEEAQQTVVDALAAQVEAATAQYDLYVKMYEYAVKLYSLAEEQQALEEQAAEAAQEKVSTTGTPEQVKQFLGEIAQAVGQDQATKDESTLARERGGDVIGALGDATDQKEREENRLAELEKLNRRKRAEFEMQLINATSDEERARIKQQKDAWDAAYREEKSRLQERISFAREVQDAAEQMADATMAGRIGPQEKAYQEEIKKLLGEQTGAIQDANELKSDAGSLDEAAITARGQLRDEERKLRDLQATGDQKKLEFEQRLNEAAGDPEKIRRIKEEQEAWNLAYKKALEAQQARVEAARRAQEDIGDESAALRERASKLKDAGGASAPDFGAGTGIEEMSQEELMKKLGFTGTGLKIDWNEYLGIPKLEQQSVRSVKAFENIQRAIAFLTDDAIPASTKLDLLGKAIKEAVGWKTWWDAIAPEETRKKVNEAVGKVFGGLDEAFGSGENSIPSRVARGWALVTNWTNETFGTGENSIPNRVSRGWAVVKDWTDRTFGSDENSIPNRVSRGWALIKAETEELFGGGENSIVERVKRGWKMLQDNATELFGDGENSIPERVKRGLDKASEWFYETFDPSKENSIPARVDRGLKAVGKFVDDWFGSGENAIPARVERGLKVVGQWFADTFGLDNENSIPNRTIRGLKVVGQWFADTFGLENQNSIPNRTERGLKVVGQWFADTFGLENQNSVPNQAKRGLDKIGQATADTFGLENQNSLTNQVIRGWNKVAQFTAGVFDTTNEDSLASYVVRGWNRLASTVGKLFSDDDPDNIVGRVKRGFGMVATAVYNAFGGEDGIVSQALSGLATLGRRIREFFSNLNPFKDGDGGGGGGGGGSGSAWGLAEVPYNGYRAVLHAGERVLTAREASIYNALEGMLKGVGSIAKAGSGGTTVQRIVQIQDVNINASNPDEGRAVMDKLAFYG